ncbi:hypothetical protein QSV37_07565 [Acinetobacter sp. VNK23]|uniref:hypothetical protein n=1 Tax=Acinetobacter thutiue TaxID=2998078 RepID=UPI002576AA9B|nr:hypothetical protein [Acinetobacter thutiue]MDM1020162.1 hypothetical protein [Acinetobacter thutiue]
MQIKELLTNVSVNYHINCYGFYFISDNIITSDKNDLVRNYYSILESIFIANKDKENEVINIIKKIFNIFKKANIIYLKFKVDPQTNEYIDINEYLKEENKSEVNSYLDFFTKGEANDLVFSQDYETLANISKRKISSNIKEKSYISLAINSFNNEVAQFGIKFHLDINEKNNNKENIKSFKDYFDFYSLTDKKEYNFINSFLNFNILEKMYFSISNRVKKNLEMLENIKNGGFSFDSDQSEADLLIKSYLDFMYKNNIAMNTYRNIKEFFIEYINFKIEFIINSNKKERKNQEDSIRLTQFTNFDIKLTKIDLFIFLNFSNKKILIKLLTSLRTALKENKDKKIENFFDNDFNISEYFQNCFNNLLVKNKSSDIEDTLSNLIMLASFSDWNSGEILIETLNKISSTYQSFQITESISTFIAFNSNFYDKRDIDFSPYIDFILNSIINNKINNLSNLAIESGKLSNIFDYMSLKKNYKNIKLIEAFIYFLKSPTSENKDLYLLKILPNLIYISNEKIQNYIHNYISYFLENEITDVKFELFLLSMIYNEKFITTLHPDTLKNYLNEFNKHLSKSFKFKNYNLDIIIIELSKRKEDQYNFFKENKEKLNL